MDNINQPIEGTESASVLDNTNGFDTEIQTLSNTINTYAPSEDKAYLNNILTNISYTLDRYYKISADTTYQIPIGFIMPYAGTVPQSGWLLCNGQAVSRTEYSDLFNTIGTLYGDGDGSTTFNVPNLINRFIQGTSENAGVTKEAGLPNITGKIFIGCYIPDTWQSGALYQLEDPDPAGTWTVGDNPDGLGFDASRSNSIYGNSNTVQPPAVQITYYIKALTIEL